MSYEKKPNTGTLGRNKRKETENHPDFAGTLNVEGRDYWLSGWTKQNKETGEKFFSLSVKPKDEKPKAEPKTTADEFSDDLPFAWAFAIPVAGVIAAVLYAKDLFQVWS
jgi:uncharacterized protein (DUF736 family)